MPLNENGPYTRNINKIKIALIFRFYRNGAPGVLLPGGELEKATWQKPCGLASFKNTTFLLHFVCCNASNYPYERDPWFRNRGSMRLTTSVFMLPAGRPGKARVPKTLLAMSSASLKMRRKFVSPYSSAGIFSRLLRHLPFM